jgi:hypothetical protein
MNMSMQDAEMDTTFSDFHRAGEPPGAIACGRLVESMGER